VKLELNEDQHMLQETVRRFVQDRVLPQVESRDRDAACPRDLLAELAGMGLLGIAVAGDWDGVGLGLEDVAVVVQELARGDAGLALALAYHNVLAAGHLDVGAHLALKEEWLGPLTRGERLGAWAHVEAGGSAPGTLETCAVRDGSDWLVDGVKVGVPLGSISDLCIITARSDEGLVALAIDGDAPGLARVAQVDPLGARTADLSTLELTRVRVPERCCIGEPETNNELVAELLARAAVVQGALGVGVGRAALAAAASYANERKQFNRPIATFQAIQWKLADAATELEAAALSVHRAAWLADTGRPFAAEAAMARLLADQAARHAADHAVQIHGGFGYTTDFPAARIYRDAELLSVLGTAPRQHRVAVARSVLGQLSR
jgi:alkylation response protein AidB-like acyl-CoA dehydrogenase